MTPAGAAASAAISQGLITELTAQLDLASSEDMAAAERTLELLAQAITALEATTPVPAGAIALDDATWDEAEPSASDRQSA